MHNRSKGMLPPNGWIIRRKGCIISCKGCIVPWKGFEILRHLRSPSCLISWPDCRFCSVLFSNISTGHEVTRWRITTILQNELRSFGLIAKHYFKIWVLCINVLCIIVSNIRNFYAMQGREGQEGSAVDEGNFRVSCRVAKEKKLNLISCVIFV